MALASYAEESSKLRDNMIIFKLLMGAITGISLVVGGIGIMNVLLASVPSEPGRLGCERQRVPGTATCLLNFLRNRLPSPAWEVYWVRFSESWLRAALLLSCGQRLRPMCTPTSR